VEKPATAEALGRRKAENLVATGADLVAAGNVGCITQIGLYADLPVVHVVQVLDRAYAEGGGV
jgi:glycolate oxidase iron-sulfur subunit